MLKGRSGWAFPDITMRYQFKSWWKIQILLFFSAFSPQMVLLRNLITTYQAFFNFQHQTFKYAVLNKRRCIRGRCGWCIHILLMQHHRLNINIMWMYLVHHGRCKIKTFHVSPPLSHISETTLTWLTTRRGSD